jgi:hypothetical protein
MLDADELDPAATGSSSKDDSEEDQVVGEYDHLDIEQTVDAAVAHEVADHRTVIVELKAKVFTRPVVDHRIEACVSVDVVVAMAIEDHVIAPPGDY